MLGCNAIARHNLLGNCGDRPEIYEEIKMTYEKLCNDILQIISTGNIQDVFCCVTRLRLIVKDKSIIDRPALEQIDGILQVKEMGNQIQLVIGTHVQDVYKDFCALTGFSEKDVLGDDEETPTKKAGSIPARILEVLSSIFAPLMPMFVTGGMIKSIVMILTTFGLLDPASGTAAVLNAIGDAPFYFLPFAAGCTTAKQFRLNQMYGLMIAGCLMYPTFMNQTMGESVQFLFFSIPAFSYASSVLPTILCVIAFSYLFRFVDKFIPANFKIVLSGTISFSLFVPVLLAVIAPIGNYAGTALSEVLMQMLTTLGPVAGAILAGFMSFIIMTGMHWAIQGVMITNLTQLGFDLIFPAMFINNIAVAGATLGAAFKIKHSDMKATAISSGLLGIIGITEPALYSIDLKYRQPLVGLIVGGAVGGFVYMLAGVKCYQYAMPGIFSIPAYIDGGSNALFMILALAAAFGVSFIYSYVKTKDIDE